MNKSSLIFSILWFYLPLFAQQKTAEDYYFLAYNEITSMLTQKDSLSIKRAVFLSEWAYYQGNLDYKKDFCDEIERISTYITKFYIVNNLHRFKTGKQMALNEYFFRPYSGNNYTPYNYNFEESVNTEGNWDDQFVSKLLKTHKGQCRSLPWMYKIIATELKADVSIAKAPRHCYIMYQDLDSLTPEKWINLELTTHQMHPSFWIKQDFQICDSAIVAGTYMTPLTNLQTIACQLADLAFGYFKKFNRYDEFTLLCSTKSLEYYPMNPTAITIRGKSLDSLLIEHLTLNNGIVDSFVIEIQKEIKNTIRLLQSTFYNTLETEKNKP